MQQHAAQPSRQHRLHMSAGNGTMLPASAQHRHPERHQRGALQAQWLGPMTCAKRWHKVNIHSAAQRSAPSTVMFFFCSASTRSLFCSSTQHHATVVMNCSAAACSINTAQPGPCSAAALHITSCCLVNGCSSMQHYRSNLRSFFCSSIGRRAHEHAAALRAHEALPHEALLT